MPLIGSPAESWVVGVCLLANAWELPIWSGCCSGSCQLQPLQAEPRCLHRADCLPSVDSSSLLAEVAGCLTRASEVLAGAPAGRSRLFLVPLGAAAQQPCSRLCRHLHGCSSALLWGVRGHPHGCSPVLPPTQQAHSSGICGTLLGMSDRRFPKLGVVCSWELPKSLVRTWGLFLFPLVRLLCHVPRLPTLAGL